MSNPELAIYCQAVIDRRASLANVVSTFGRVELVSPYTDDSVTTESLAAERKREILQYRKATFSKKSEQYYRAVMRFSQRVSSTCPE
jgi:hypothetical protein